MDQSHLSPSAGVTCVDYVEFWVGNIDQALYFLENGLGFTRASVEVIGSNVDTAAVLQQGRTTIVLRQGLHAASEVSQHVTTHGDTVRDVALLCARPETVAEQASLHGMEVEEYETGVRFHPPMIPTVRHSLRTAPLVAPTCDGKDNRPEIDHVTYCLPFGSADDVTRSYCSVLGFRPVHDTGYGVVGDRETGMRSVVIRSGQVALTLTAPASATSRGQTARFLDAHAGPGVQHLALAYGNLIAAIDEAHERGVGFLPVSRADLDTARTRLGNRRLPWAKLIERGVLVDSDDDGLLFQVFTKFLTGRQTFFFEMLQRDGATGFGANNFRALFDAVERGLAR